MPPKCDVLLITAVDVESEAIRGWSNHWKKFMPEDDSTVYEYIEAGVDDFQHNLVHVQQPEMGMTAAAVFATKSITHFCPQYVIMTGIAAGLDKGAEVGDIMVATDVLNYSGGKYVETDDSVKLLPDLKNKSMDRALADKLTSPNYQDVMKQIKNNFEGDSPNHKPKVHFGQIACGTAVVASDAVVTEQIKAHSRKVIGLDMESYGVYFAAQFVKDPGIKAIVVKSISDFANSQKGDAYQKYAAYTSAEFAKHLICNVLEFE